MAVLRKYLVCAAVAVAALAAAAPSALASAALPGTAQAAQSLTTTASGGQAVARRAPSCKTPGEDFHVNANGIGIRGKPNGTVRYKIAKGAVFRSAWGINAGDPHFCFSNGEPGGQLWVKGWAKANGHAGWVGLDYLDFYRFVS